MQSKPGVSRLSFGKGTGDHSSLRGKLKFPGFPGVGWGAEMLSMYGVIFNHILHRI